MRNINGKIIEISCISSFILGLYFYSEVLNSEVSLAKLLLNCSALLLLQGLIRDVCILFFLIKKTSQRHSRNKESVERNKEDKIKIPCICIESAIGVLGIIIGGILLYMVTGTTVHMTTQAWWVLFSSVAIFGFLIKDYVLHWNPWKIVKEQDHINISFAFKE